MKKIAVVLSGCGVYDGAEIHEATLTLLAINKQNAEYEIFAPDIQQHHVINHITGEEMNETRNVLIESARIARGNIKNLSEFDSKHFDAIIFPGGFGVAKNLCSFAFEGTDCVVNEEVENAIKEMFKLNKPIGGLCISPVLLAKVLGEIDLTIGQDQGTADAIEKMEATHVKSSFGEVIIDKNNNIYTTPCYMLESTISQIADGINNIIKAMLAGM